VVPIALIKVDIHHRGAHETPGTWRLGGFADDVADIRIVVSHLTRKLGYKIALVVGHSRGSVAGLTWMCTSEEGLSVLGYVNCSGRYRMEVCLAFPLQLPISCVHPPFVPLFLSDPHPPPPCGGVESIRQVSRSSRLPRRDHERALTSRLLDRRYRLCRRPPPVPSGVR
jgi:pimeloyl-ACP methyl ester carboxylesterase